MRTIMFSTDKNVFNKDSEVRKRMLDYSRSLEELHIIVYTNKSENKKPEIEKNLFLYPTNTSFKPLYFLDAYRIGQKIISQFPNFQISQSLITCQDPFETGLVGYLLKKKFKLSLELQAHTDFLSPYFKKESVKNKLRFLLAKFLLKRADKIRVVSERIKESLVISNESLADKITVKPIFVDVEKIKNTPITTDLRKKYLDYDFIILMVSRLTREKNIGLAIEAIAEIKETLVSDFLLLIVGDGPEREALKLKIADYKLQNRVIMEPPVNFETLISYYKTADLLLITSSYEGYGRTAVEAQAAGLPVLMTDVGVAIGEVFPVGDLKTLVAKLSSKLSKLK